MDSTSFAPRACAELRTLGVVGLLVNGTPRLERRRKSLALLAYLARHAPARLSRAELATLLWVSSPAERARQSLRQALAELRQALGDALQSTTEQAWIDPSRLELDVTALERDLDAGRVDSALARHTGAFLDGFDGIGGAPFDRWLALQRERVESRLASLVRRSLPPRNGGPPARPVEEPAIMSRAARRIAAATTPLRSVAPIPRMMDRAEARRTLGQAWIRACQGGSEAVLIEGDGGFGKSHVLEQFVREAQLEQPQSVVLMVRALESERRQPGALVRQLLAAAPDKAVPRDDALDSGMHPVCDMAGRVAGVVPLLVVVDDADLADDGSQDAIGALVQAPPGGALVVVAVRPFMLSEVRFRAALQRNTALQRVALAPMRTAETETMLRALLPLEEGLASALAARLGEERLGNAGLIEATIAAMVDDGYLVEGSDGSWRLGRDLPTRLPIVTDVRERTRRVLPRLSAGARQVIEAAAVPGDAVDLPLLAMAVTLDATALQAAVAELSGRRLLRPSVRGDGWLEFMSGAVRHAVLDQLGLPRRRALQRGHERAVRRRQGARARERITYAERAGDRSPMAFLRSTLTAAAGLLD